MRWLVALSLALSLTQYPDPEPTKTPEVEAIEHASAAERLSLRFMLCLAEKETGIDASKKSYYLGLYQFDPETWKSQSPRFGFAGFSPFHGWANAHVAAGMIAERGRDRVWLLQQWPPAAGCGDPFAVVATPTPPTPTPWKDLDLG